MRLCSQSHGNYFSGLAKASRIYPFRESLSLFYCIITTQKRKIMSFVSHHEIITRSKTLDVTSLSSLFTANSTTASAKIEADQRNGHAPRTALPFAKKSNMAQNISKNTSSSSTLILPPCHSIRQVLSADTEERNSRCLHQ
jgi:hypothetical protein